MEVVEDLEDLELRCGGGVGGVGGVDGVGGGGTISNSSAVKLKSGGENHVSMLVYVAVFLANNSTV